MGTIGLNLIPSKSTEETKKKWYEKGNLDVDGAFYNVESISVVTPDADYHAQKWESKIVSKIAKVCFLLIIFMPFNIVTLIAALDIKKREGENPALKQAIYISIAGTVITIAGILVSLFVTPKMLGIKI